jgi:GT2 family glycosyltransferase
MNTAVFVTTQNVWRYADLACRSIEENTPEDVELHLVDDASDDLESVEWADGLEAAGRWKVWRHDEKEGLTYGWNQALQYCLDEGLDSVTILNNDIIVPPGWWDTFKEVFDADPKIGIVSCLTNQEGHQPQMGIRSLFDFLTWEQINDWQVTNGLTYWLRHRAQVKNEFMRYLPYVNGFAFTVRREVIEHTGLIDTVKYRNLGNEDFLQAKMKEAGWKAACTLKSFMFHWKRVTLPGLKSTHKGREIPRLGDEVIKT